MKARIIVGEDFQDIEIEHFEVSYNKYEGIDLYVLLTPKESLVAVSDDKKDEQWVAKPSSAGIIKEEDIFSTDIPVSGLFENADTPSWLLIERQKNKVNWCRPGKSLEEVTIIEKDRVISSDVFTFAEANMIVFIDAIKKAVTQVVEREKLFAQDYFLYAVKEPVVMFGKELDNKVREFYVIEQVTKVQLITDGKFLEDTTKENL